MHLSAAAGIFEVDCSRAHEEQLAGSLAYVFLLVLFSFFSRLIGATTENTHAYENSLEGPRAAASFVQLTKQSARALVAIRDASRDPRDKFCGGAVYSARVAQCSRFGKKSMFRRLQSSFVFS